MALPFEKQKALFAGQMEAFAFFGEVPQRITNDNLKMAVFKVLEGPSAHRKLVRQPFMDLITRIEPLAN